MNAITICYNETIGTGDMGSVINKSLGGGNWLETAVYTSLFTNKRNPETSEQGYWGDVFNGESYGSLLYTLARSKLYSVTLGKANDYCRDALSWLVKGDYVKSFDVSVSAVNDMKLQLIVVLTLPDNTDVTQIEEYSLAA